jgi:ATP-dependent DNA ligase
VGDAAPTTDVVASRHRLEGIVAKRRNGTYRPGFRGWTKIKNQGYWRRESEIELMRRRRERVGAQQSLNPA